MIWGSVLTQRRRDAEGGTPPVASAATAVPSLRFKGFDGVWERKTLGDLLTVSTEINERNDFGIYDVLSVSGDSGVVNQIEFQGRSFAGASVANYHVLRHGQVVYTKSPLKANPFGIIKANRGVDGIVSVLYGVYDCREEVDFGFVQDYFDFVPRLNNYLRPLVCKGAKNTLLISDDEALRGVVWFPMGIEQERISLFINSTDALIAAREKALDKLVQFKKAMLEKMFPRMGAKVPEVRFKGFDGEWEEKTFDSLAKIRRGLTYSPVDCAKSGIRVLRSSNIDEDKFALYDDDVFVTPDAVNIPFVRGGDILVTAANGSSNLVGKHALIPDDCGGCVHGGFMYLISSVEYEFINAWMSTVWYRRFVATSMMGGNGALGNLAASAFDELKLLIPNSVEEQRKIGAYFRSLDALISARREEIGKLKDLKKALLDRMFI